MGGLPCRADGLAAGAAAGLHGIAADCCQTISAGPAQTGTASIPLTPPQTPGQDGPKIYQAVGPGGKWGKGCQIPPGGPIDQYRGPPGG